MKKLPPGWRQSFFEKYEPEVDLDNDEEMYTTLSVATIDHLLKFLQKKIHSLKRSELAEAEGQKPKADSRSDKARRDHGGYNKAKNFAITPSESEERPSKSGKTDAAAKEAAKVEKNAKTEEKAPREGWFCLSCEKKGHTMPYCAVYKAMAPTDRLRTAIDTKVCFSCLTRHGRKEFCPAAKKRSDGSTIPIKCSVDDTCRMRHHFSLHGAKWPEDRQRKGNGTRRRSTGKETTKADEETKSVAAGSTASYSVLPNSSAHPPHPTRLGRYSRKLMEEGKALAARPPHHTQDKPASQDRQEPKKAYATINVRGETLRLIRLMFRPAGDVFCKPRKTVALVDPGSTLCFVDEGEMLAFRKELLLKPAVTVSTMHGTRTAPSAEVDLEISRDGGRTWRLVPGVDTCRNLRLTGPKLPWTKFIKENPEFARVEADDVSFAEVRMLLGAPLENEFLPLEEPGSRIIKNGVSAYKTKLGWTIGGKLSSVIGGARVYTVLPSLPAGAKIFEENAEVEESLALLQQFKRFNDLEELGVKPRAVKASRQQEIDQEDLDASTKWENGRIVTRMLWKGQFQSLPDTEPMARKRLKWLQNKLSKQGLWEKYAETIKSDVEKGYVKKLSAEEAANLRKSLSWFLPHFVVVHPDKPDRPRRVLDCAAKVGGLSLNSLLRKGPKNLADLWGVMLRSRTNPVLFIGDVTEMFPQVAVAPGDEKLLAFLWSESPDQEPEVYVNVRHVFGAKCSPAIAINALHEAVRRKCPEHLDMVKREVYMDDWLHGDETPLRAIKIAKEVLDALSESGFSMGKFVSNSKTFLQAFPADKISPKFKEIEAKEGEGYGLPVTKALGLRWNAEQDLLGFATRLQVKEPNSVAECLSQLASLFDPLQIVGPFIMKGKLLFQALFHTATRERGGKSLYRQQNSSRGWHGSRISLL